jgi:hypothetical protein
MGVSARVFRAQAAATLTVRMDGERLYVSSPDLHFLTGKPLDRLKDGREVTFLAQLSLSLDANRTIFRPVHQRFIFSRDVWDEKFSVTRVGSLPRKGLTAAAAEAWCLESLAISAAGIAPEQPVWMRLDLRVADMKDQADMVSEGPISVRAIIDTFSKPARTLQPHWTVDVPPFRLLDLRKAGSRGPRSG